MRVFELNRRRLVSPRLRFFAPPRSFLPKSKMKTVVYLTLEVPGDFYIYDQLTVEPLRKRGWNVIEIPWSQQNVDWNSFDRVVIRSTWDYQSDVAHFLRVLETIEASTAQLDNPLPIVRWNMRKTYLRDLAEKLVTIVPTLWMDRLGEDQLSENQVELWLEQFATTQLIVKPQVGANADDTFWLSTSQSNEMFEQAKVAFANRACMIQPFVESVLSEGEYSLFYFNGMYSHAIVKRPKSGDFRVQEEHGARIESIDADEDLREAGDKVIDAIGYQLLYARIDLIRLPDGRPALMEAELIEPSLYFNYDAEASDRFADAFMETVEAR